MAIGIHTARANSTPMVALLGQVQRDHRGREAFQESDLVASPGRLAKWAREIDDPTDAPRLVGEGLSAMLSGRPGPVLFALPEDTLDKVIGDRSTVAIDPRRPVPPPDGHVQSIVHRLSAATRPAILAGHGVTASNATDALIELSEALDVPVFAAWRRPTAFPNDHPNFLGTTGYGAPRTVRDRLENADALLVIGCRLNEVASFDYTIPRPGTWWAHVDLHPRTAHGGLTAPDMALAADARAFLASALEIARESMRYGQSTTAVDRGEFLAATALPERTWNGPGVDPVHIIATLQRVLANDAILTTDAGNFGLWPARYLKFGRSQTFLGPTSGAMGYGLPAAIAASLAAPDRQVVALCGDGGLAMTMNELETAVRTGAKPVVLVFDNEKYGTIAMHQANEQRASVATSLGPIDFAAIARACGAQGVNVTGSSEFEPALRAALASGRPTVLQLDLDPRWISPDRGPA
jgi:acetolactate synthase-1/2/3 large subunit